jgi:hypothetical protein
MLDILLVSGTPLCCIHMCFTDQCHSYHCSYTNCCRGRNIVELPAHIDSLDIYKLERLYNAKSFWVDHSQSEWSTPFVLQSRDTRPVNIRLGWKYSLGGKPPLLFRLWDPFNNPWNAPSWHTAPCQGGVFPLLALWMGWVENLGICIAVNSYTYHIIDTLKPKLT